ncbi:hypothetical protein K440DRAFT_678881 [Wilcoxina mikolae CBS 423.85]|nr:hypothetical protein K440DRAFT_678881 [Wilcoxina mikolae CBS 423.85]
MFLLIGLAQGEPNPSQSTTSTFTPPPTTVRTHDDSHAVGMTNLVATILGVMVTAIGVFGWKCWKVKKGKAGRQSVDLLPRVHTTAGLVAFGDKMPTYPHIGASMGGVNYFHYHAPWLPPQPTATDELVQAAAQYNGGGPRHRQPPTSPSQHNNADNGNQSPSHPTTSSV